MTTFPIQEESLVEYIQRHISENALESIVFREPKPVSGIQKALKTRSFLVDLSYTFEEDVRVGEELFVAKGTRVNPLANMQLSLGMLFFDSTDLAQLAWAKKQPKHFLWVLIRGNPLELEQKVDREVYFDQLGFYTSKFEIRAVPARVSQQGDQMLVEEIFLDEKGEER